MKRWLLEKKTRMRCGTVFNFRIEGVSGCNITSPRSRNTQTTAAKPHTNEADKWQRKTKQKNTQTHTHSHERTHTACCHTVQASQQHKWWVGFFVLLRRISGPVCAHMSVGYLRETCFVKCAKSFSRGWRRGSAPAGGGWG